MARRTLALIAVAALAAIGLFVVPLAVGDWGGDRTTSPDASLGDQCRKVPESARRVTLSGADGRSLGAASVGDAAASTAVVLRHGASQTLCDWLDWAEEIATEHEVRVLLFDRRGQGSSPGAEGLADEPNDLVAAVERAREDGADDVVLVASSMGNSVMFSALPLLEAAEQPICAGVAISPVLTAGPLDGRSPTPLPPVTWLTWEAQDPGITAYAEGLVDEADRQGVDTRTLSVDSDHHSLALVKNHDNVRAFVSEAVSSCA